MNLSSKALNYDIHCNNRSYIVIPTRYLPTFKKIVEKENLNKNMCAFSTKCAVVDLEFIKDYQTVIIILKILIT